MEKKLTILFLMIFLPMSVFSAASSTNYQIDDDSLNVLGGFSSSDNYQLEDTGGESATDNMSSENYRLKAGYQAMSPGSMTIGFDSLYYASLAISLDSSSRADSDFLVWEGLTRESGYALFLNAQTSPALRRAVTDGFEEIFDYNGVDYEWTVGSTESAFGFNPYAVSGDVPTAFKTRDGVACGSGSSGVTWYNIDSQCWDGFSTTPRLVAFDNDPNLSDYESVHVNLKVEIGSDVNLNSGTSVSGTTVNFTALLEAVFVSL